MGHSRSVCSPEAPPSCIPARSLRLLDTYVVQLTLLVPEGVDDRIPFDRSRNVAYCAKEESSHLSFVVKY